MICGGCDHDVHPWQDMMVPSGKLIDKCPREGCGFTFGEHRDDCAESPRATPALATHVAPILAPVAPVAPTVHVAPGTAGLVAGLELRLAELDSEASMIRRMLRAAAEGVH